MKISTILPIEYLRLERFNDYHLCLAHLLNDSDYFTFFFNRAREGKFVLMDNGVVETGRPLPMEKLLNLALRCGFNEVILPDSLNNRKETLSMGAKAIEIASEGYHMVPDLMAVPQGNTKDDWIQCVNEMLDWPVNGIGISRFTKAFFEDRVEALLAVEDLISSSKEIHILGCPGDPSEIARIECTFPGRVRGTDSGIAAIFTQAGRRMSDGGGKPDIALDFHNNRLDAALLKENIEWWIGECRGIA